MTRLLRLLPALARVGLAEAVAYRAELLVWVLATTMPFIMMALWSTVAKEHPIGGFTEEGMIQYFLVTFVVRQLTGSWAAWQINLDIKNGTLALRLLRPVHPLVAYAVEQFVSIPLRALVSLPVVAALFFYCGTAFLPKDLSSWVLACLSIVGGFSITLLVNFIIGSVAFFTESSNRILDIWLAGFLLLSGYYIPTSLFPSVVRSVSDWLPFRYQLGFSVELLLGRIGPHEALLLLGRQWLMVLLLWGLCLLAYRRGIARFSAFGG